MEWFTTNCHQQQFGQLVQEWSQCKEEGLDGLLQGLTDRSAWPSGHSRSVVSSPEQVRPSGELNMISLLNKPEPEIDLSVILKIIIKVILLICNFD